MAEEALKKSKHSKVKQVDQDIITSRKAEIKQKQQWWQA